MIFLNLGWLARSHYSTKLFHAQTNEFIWNKSPKQAKQRFKGQLANEMKKERESQLNMCKTKTSCVELNSFQEDPLATNKKIINLFQK